MNSHLPLMPLPACETNDLITCDAESGNWLYALPHSTPRDLANERRRVLCPDDWIAIRNSATGRFRRARPSIARK